MDAATTLPAAGAGAATPSSVSIAPLRRDFAMGAALKQGDRAPEFDLPDGPDGTVSLASRLQRGPVVLIFYRGGWCPYCNIQLRAYQRALAAVDAAGGQVMALSPQTPEKTRETKRANALTFDVLSDTNNAVAHAFGIAYRLPEELQAVMTANDKALPGMNGDDSWELPLAATYVIAPDGTLALAATELDYRRRLEPDDAVSVLRSMRTEAAAAD